MRARKPLHKLRCQVVARLPAFALPMLLLGSAFTMVACTDEDPLAKSRPIMLATSEAETLVKLQDENPTVRLNGVKGLGYSTLPNALELLTAALTDSSWEVRREAAMLLGKAKDARAVDSLIEAAKDGETSMVRFEAVRALGSIGDVRAKEALVAAMYDDDTEVWKEAEAALSKMGVSNLTPIREKAAIERDRRRNEAIAAHDRRVREEERARARMPDVGVCTCKNAQTGMVMWERKVKSIEECYEQCPDGTTRF